MTATRKPPPGTRAEQIYKQWVTFHRANPRVYELFEYYTFQTIQAGHKRYSADAVVHRIRWHVNIETRPVDEFKINNNFVSYYARLFMRKNRQYSGFFETRVRTSVRRVS